MLQLFENVKVTLTIATYGYLIILCLTFHPDVPFYHKCIKNAHFEDSKEQKLSNRDQGFSGLHLT